jgi:DNA-binding NtrC family response regulator
VRVLIVEDDLGVIDVYKLFIKKIIPNAEIFIIKNLEEYNESGYDQQEFDIGIYDHILCRQPDSVEYSDEIIVRSNGHIKYKCMITGYENDKIKALCKRLKIDYYKKPFLLKDIREIYDKASRL